MGRGPHDAPLGAKPTLPPPSGAAAARAGRAFRDYVDRLRAEEVAPAPEPAPPAVSAPGGGRSYALALAKVAGGPASGPPPVEGGVAEELAAEGAATPPDAEPPFAPPPERPPPGAPTVRPPVRRVVSESLPQEVLEGAADSALLSTDEAGGAAFDIVFNDELFADLACRISVTAGRVVATFRARDQNLCRLLNAEAGRLRVRLEERGLKVSEVRVELEG